MKFDSLESSCISVEALAGRQPSAWWQEISVPVEVPRNFDLLACTMGKHAFWSFYIIQDFQPIRDFATKLYGNGILDLTWVL